MDLDDPIFDNNNGDSDQANPSHEFYPSEFQDDNEPLDGLFILWILKIFDHDLSFRDYDKHVQYDFDHRDFHDHNDFSIRDFELHNH